MVALIALVPALIVLVVSFWTDSKGWTLFSAILMAALGALTGNPIFAVLDVLVVYGAYVLAKYLLKERLFEKNMRLERLHHANLNAEISAGKHAALMAANKVASDARRVELKAKLALMKRAEAAAQTAAVVTDQEKQKG